MVYKYVYGEPIETESVVKTLEICQGNPEMFEVEASEDQLIFTAKMDPEDIVFGLGEQVRGINKRGFKYISYAADDPVHSEDKNSLYGAHNFLIVFGKKIYGIFVDYPGEVTFDVGFEKIDDLKVTCGKDLAFYVITGESLKEVTKTFREMIGQSYVAPKWAFGYQQSRWGYVTDDDVRDVVKKYHGNGIPLEAVYLDIDYMDHYKDFTVDVNRFPDFEAFVSEMKDEGVHLVPIIDAGVKIEKDYDIYEEGVKKGYFCKDADGNDFVGAVWPGRVHFPDFLRPEVRHWFGHKYAGLMNMGIDGFWNDMNEPALFYSEKRLGPAFDEIISMRGQNMGINESFRMKDIVLGLANSREDYKNIFHNVNGKMISNDSIHNIYGYNMTRAAGEAMKEIAPDKRTLIFSRSSYIGMHRYGGIWTGDNCSWWQHLLLSIQQMPSLNMCGFLYTGSDIGGFGSHTSEELLTRWLQFGLFTPLMRNHACIGTREQEVYQFDNMDNMGNAIRIRYRLLPYLYSEFMKSVINSDMYFRPLAFDYQDDPRAVRVEDQLLVGESIMIAPVYTQNARGRYVYLPETMQMVRMTSDHDYSCEVLEKGDHYISVGLHEVVFFIREGYVVPMSTSENTVLTTKDLKNGSYEWLGFVTDQASYKLYDDDGYTSTFIPEEEWKTFTFTAADFR